MPCTETERRRPSAIAVDVSAQVNSVVYAPETEEDPGDAAEPNSETDIHANNADIAP
nr:hypothetical protein JVH1_6970 [Rhodococcus sp. JVH1]